MTGTVDISVIITAHREGILVGATAASARRAIACVAADLGRSCEVVAVLDRADAATSSTLENAFPDLPLTVLHTDEGDPGQARNRGVATARGECLTFLDGDDLWSDNWLTEAARLIDARPDCIAHSACNLTFGKERNLWWHVDSESALFNPASLEWGNYWDAMTFGRTAIYRRYPFRKNDLRLGFGHEDWHWNAWTIAENIPHKPVPETMHFKRRRSVSQMALVERSGSIRWPLGV